MSSNPSNNFPRIVERKRRTKDVPGAIVIGGDYQGLGIVRSLGRRGIPVCVIDDEYSIARHSRYTNFAAQFPDLRHADKTVAALMELEHRLNLRGWVLFPTRDELVAALSTHRSILSELYRVPTAVWETVRWAWDKRNTYQLAKKLGIPIPETWFPETLEDLDQIDAAFPLVLKPAIKEHFFYSTKVKAWRANSRTELRELFQKGVETAGPGEILIQDMIPGDGRYHFGYCACFKEGKALGSMVVCRRRQHPRDFGRASTYVQTIDLPVLETLSDSFLKAINYYGLVEVEFKLDPRDGQFKLLDVNARTWGYHALGFIAGVDFPYLLYKDQLGATVKPCRAKPGYSWIRLLTDFPTVAIELTQGRLSIRDYVNSLWGIGTEAVFSREDPIPGFVECVLIPYLASKRGF
jgi:predicted ATP-grasp superfamily ATP-dependent carboligase